MFKSLHSICRSADIHQLRVLESKNIYPEWKFISQVPSPYVTDFSDINLIPDISMDIIKVKKLITTAFSKITVS